MAAGRAAAWAWGAWAVTLGLPLTAALLGSTRGHPLVLNLGPGDSPYISGFSPQYEIDDKVSTHWTTYEAAVRLPLYIDGPSELSYRYARIFPQTAVVEIVAPAGVVDRFNARGGIFEERRARVPQKGPAELRLRADSHERQDRGLKMDRVAFLPDPGVRVRLRGRALAAPVVVILLVLVLHRLLGFRTASACALTAPWAVALAAGLVFDPWITHRLLRGIPTALVLFGAVGLWVASWLRRGQTATAEDIRTVGALCVAAFLVRAAAVNHPDFYYPDLRTHARLVETVRTAGLQFFLTPAHYIAEHGVWRTQAYGQTYAFPYTPAFHLPFAVLRLPYDGLIAAMKLTAAAITLVPLCLVWALARRAGLSPLGAVLMVAIPTYTSRLSYAFLPSLLGHAVDLAFLYWLTTHLERLSETRVWLTAAAFVTACQLAYVSGVTNISLLVALLAVSAALGLRDPARGRGPSVDWPLGLRILSFGLLGALVSVALYYRDFLGMVLDMLPRISGQAASASRYPVRGFWEVAAGRTWDFFGAVYPILAAVGLARLFARGDEVGGRRIVRVVAAAWLGTYVLLLLGRAKVPDVFLHGHETLLLTPLVCLAAGEALSAVWRTGRAGRLAAAALLAFLTVRGFWLQWRALADQLGNAI
jgi:hypothetical protein